METIKNDILAILRFRGDSTTIQLWRILTARQRLAVVLSEKWYIRESVVSRLCGELGAEGKIRRLGRDWRLVPEVGK